LAEVWFKPEGDPFALTFRIPQASFQAPGLVQLLTTENLLKAVGIATQEVESWRQGDGPDSGMNLSGPELGHPLPSPPPNVAYVDIHVSLKRAPQAAAPNESGKPEMSSLNEAAAPNESGKPEMSSLNDQDLEARWNAILGLESGIDSLRLSLEGLQVELEAAWKKTLRPEEKLHALRADVVQWNKAKSRIHFVVPKLKDFVQRATWALTTPERKKLDELFKNYVDAGIPFSETDRVPDQLESLLKGRQILSGQGTTVYQECKAVLADVEGALRTLKNNAVKNERQKNAMRAGGKFFKDIRRLSMGPP
jgi:hypothetical protein